MEVKRIAGIHGAYPHTIRRYLGEQTPASLFTLGSLGILREKKVGFFCSVRCPGTPIVETYDLAVGLRDAGVTVVSGFHSPMERECLAFLMRGEQPIIICPSSGLTAANPLEEYRSALQNGRLLFLSLFADDVTHATTATALVRNDFVAALADAVFVAYAAPGSKTEIFCRKVITWGKPLLTLGVKENAALLRLGAQAYSPGDPFW